MRLAALGTAVSLAVAGLTVVATPAAAADSVFALPVNQVTDILVDDAHSRVFLVGGGSYGLLVRSLEGAAVTTVENQPGATNMALSPDGTRVYLALAAGDAVSAIDTTTLAEVARYATGAATCPTSVTAVGTQVWFGYGCGGSAGNVGVVELAGETPTVTLDRKPATVSFGAPPRVEISPSAPTRMVAGSLGASPAKIHAFDVVDGATLTAVASREVGSNLQDLTVTPDGAHVVTASGYPYQHLRYKTSDLSSDGVYGSSNPYPTAVAVAPTGHVFAGSNGVYDPDVHVYSTGGALLRRYEVDCCNSSSQRLSALAVTADATRLYTASNTGYYGTTTYLHVRRDPTRSVSTITLAKPVTTPKVRTAFTIKGRLTATTPVAGGRTLRVSRSSVYGTSVRPSVTTASDGTFAISDTVYRRGSYTYTVSWSGDSAHAGTSRTVTFAVRGLTPSLSIATNATTFKYGATARIAVRLGSTYGNRAVSIVATPLDRAPRTLKTGTVDSTGYLRASHAPTRRTVYTASFAGDAVYEPRQVSTAVRVYARVTQKMSGHYTTSNGQYVFRRSADPTISVTVLPAGGAGCVWTKAERYVSGAWRLVADSPCLWRDGSGVAQALLYGDPMTGVRYRVRSLFEGNGYALRAYSGYTYFTFT